MTQQRLKLEMNEYDGPYSKMLLFPYAIWHNQRTGMVAVHTDLGYFKFPADAVKSIEMQQPFLEFSEAQ